LVVGQVVDVMVRGAKHLGQEFANVHAADAVETALAALS
jgi:hypothetical protein